MAPQFDFLNSQGQYMDIRAGIAADTNLSLQLTASTATQFILPTPAFGVRKGSVGYDPVNGAIEFNESGYYESQFMLNCVASANAIMLYRAATLDQATGNPVAFGTAGRVFGLTNATDQLITVTTYNYWTAGTKLILYFTVSNVTNLVLRRATSTPIGAQVVTQEAARFQITGRVGA